MPKPIKRDKPPKAIFTNHCVVFIDFLGFRNVINSGSREMGNLLQISKAIQASESDFQMTLQPISEELGSIELKAAISAFSDHVVISYPLERMYIDDGLNDQTVPHIVMDHARKFIANIASVAFTLACLSGAGSLSGSCIITKGWCLGKV
jgi:hypothetical protein